MEDIDFTKLTKEEIYNVGYELWCDARGKERGKNEITEKISPLTKKIFLFLATPIQLLQNIEMFFIIFTRSGMKDAFGKLRIHIEFEKRYLEERGWIEG